MFIKRMLILSAIIVFTQQAYADVPTVDTITPCGAIDQQIAADFQEYPVLKASQQLPWMTLDWMTKQLGTPAIQGVTQIFYIWKDLVAFDNGIGGFSLVEGTLAANTSLSLTDLTKTLGQPVRMTTQIGTQYKWQCGDSATVMMLISPYQVTQYVGVAICSAAQCSSHSVTLK